LSSFVDRRHLVEYPPDRKQRNDEIREEIARCRDLLIQLTGSPVRSSGLPAGSTPQR